MGNIELSMGTMLQEQAAAPYIVPDFNERPYIVIWEMTQACDLVCVHCRASAQPLRSALELTTIEAKRLIDEVVELEAPVFVLTGGDPLKRPDLFELVEYAAGKRVRTSLSPSATPLLTQEAIVELKARGLARLALSLDGADADVHDAFRGVAGSFERTLEAARWAREIGLPLQINTTFSRRNVAAFDAIAKLVGGLHAVLWSVFFLVPTGRGKTEGLLSAEEFEEIFAKLYKLSQTATFDIKTTEAQHYRRYAAQQRALERRSARSQESGVPLMPEGELDEATASQASDARRIPSDGIARVRRGINDAKGFVFISHLGQVFPSGFLPLSAGSVRRQSLAEIYRNSPLFRQLRDPERLKGKCGICEFRNICGGSRARAFALTGDPLAEESCCIYQPRPKAH